MRAQQNYAWPVWKKQSIGMETAVTTSTGVWFNRYGLYRYLRTVFKARGRSSFGPDSVLVWLTFPVLSIVIAIATVPVTLTPSESFWQAGSSRWMRSVSAILE